MTPTQRSRDLLRRSGYQVETVERWLPRVNRRRDCFGCADLLAVSAHREPRFLLVQATSLSNVSARVKKSQGCPALAVWLAAGGAFEVWGWSGPDVKRVALTGADLTAEVVELPRRRQRQKKHEQKSLFDVAE